jgi:hypothetical protein
MIPFVTPGELRFLVDFEECTLLKERPLEAIVVKEGEVPTDKKAVLRYAPKQQELLHFETLPKGADWDAIKVVELTLNEEAYTKFRKHGGICYPQDPFDLYLLDKNFVGKPF